jgi:glutamate synthase domain-containing protein 3
MTGGTVVVLGQTGRNFAAGMSGGVAYVYDADGQFNKRCNSAMVTLEPVLTPQEQDGKVDKAIWHRGLADETLLKSLIEKHFKYTGSLAARYMLDHWPEVRSRFVKVFPTEYQRALRELNAPKRIQQERVAA